MKRSVSIAQVASTYPTYREEVLVDFKATDGPFPHQGRAKLDSRKPSILEI